MCTSHTQTKGIRYGRSPPTDDCMMSESLPAGEKRLTERICASQVLRLRCPNKDGRNELPIGSVLNLSLQDNNNNNDDDNNK